MPLMGEGHLPLVYIPDGAGRYIKAPVLTTTQRDALTAKEGMVIFNSTTDQLEEYDGATWQAVGQVILDTHTATLNAHIQDVKQIMLAGQYIPLPTLVGSSSATLAANNLYALLFYVPRDLSVDRLAISVKTGAASSAARLGIYRDAGSLTPTGTGNLVKDAGTVDTSSAAVVAATISPNLALTKGYYWFALITNGTPTLYVPSFTSTLPLGILASALNDAYAGYTVSQTYGALPSNFPASPTLTLTGSLPGIMARVASLD